MTTLSVGRGSVIRLIILGVFAFDLLANMIESINIGWGVPHQLVKETASIFKLISVRPMIGFVSEEGVADGVHVRNRMFTRSNCSELVIKNQMMLW
jgi:hypothetical protein